MIKRITIDLAIVLGIASFLMGVLLLSNYLHYGTFLF